MLGSKDVMATIAVKDIQAAKKFYEGVLGLKLADDGEPEALSLHVPASYTPESPRKYPLVVVLHGLGGH